MTAPDSDPFDLFLVAPPGLEPVLADEARALGFDSPRVVAGGVETRGDWPEVWRANLQLRGAVRVLVRLGSFPVFHLAQLDKRAHRFPWASHLRPDVPLRVEVTCRKSKIYHAGAAAQRVETAITDELGAPIVQAADAAAVTLKLRIDDNRCTISLDSSGEPLHRRGHKEFVGKAPLRETLAAMFLCQCGFDGSGPLVDPMCGSGTFVLEAAEMAAGLMPGRTRSFAFEQVAGFDAAAWGDMRRGAGATTPERRFFGFDRDDGAIRGASANARRAGVDGWAGFARQPVSDLAPPDGPPGLVMVNPPYGGRIGSKKLLYGLYGSLGKVLKERFTGWRIGLVTSEPGLARATALPFKAPGPPVPHGGLKVTLWQTGAL